MRILEAGLLIALFMPSGAPSAQTSGPWRADPSNTRGWEFMSPEERIEHQARVRSFTDYGACETYRTHHHELMEARARQRGLPPLNGGQDFCGRLRPLHDPSPD